MSTCATSKRRTILKIKQKMLGALILAEARLSVWDGCPEDEKTLCAVREAIADAKGQGGNDHES